MEVDDVEIQRQVSKFQRVSSNGSTTTTDNSSNPSIRANLELQNHVEDVAAGVGVARLCGWPSSRIVRVSRASGGKDRHSKVLTSKGPRDRRVRLSVNTAIQFYDLQDRLGYDQPSKAVEWLLKAAASSIDELPSLDPAFFGAISGEKKPEVNVSKEKSPTSSSTSETSKGSGLSLSRSENRNKARDRAREMAANKKDKEKKNDSTTVMVLNQVNNFPESSSFTDLLTGGINTTRSPPINYFFNHSTQPSPQLIQVPQFNITTGDNNNNNNHNHQQSHHHFSFLQDSYVPAVTGGESYNLNFAMTSSTAATGGGVVNAPGGFSRGTLQSNLQSSLMPHHHHLQRFQSDGSTATNLPFFIVPNSALDHYPGAGGYYGGDGGGRRSDYHKEKSKN